MYVYKIYYLCLKLVFFPIYFTLFLPIDDAVFNILCLLYTT